MFKRELFKSGMMVLITGLDNTKKHFGTDSPMKECIGKLLRISREVSWSDGLEIIHPERGTTYTYHYKDLMIPGYEPTDKKINFKHPKGKEVVFDENQLVV